MVQHESKNASVILISVAAKSNSMLFNCWWFNTVEHGKLFRSNVLIVLSSIITSHSLEQYWYISGDKTVRFILYSVEIDMNNGSIFIDL